MKASGKVAADREAKRVMEVCWKYEAGQTGEEEIPSKEVRNWQPPALSRAKSAGNGRSRRFAGQ